MTGLSILRHAYALMDQPHRLAGTDGNESGLLAVNQIYAELWPREHRDDFRPLEHLRQTVQLSYRFLPAMTLLLHLQMGVSISISSSGSSRVTS